MSEIAYHLYQGKKDWYGWIPDQKGLDEVIESQPVARDVIYNALSRSAVKDDNGDRFLWRPLKGLIGNQWWKDDPRSGGSRLLSLDQGNAGSCVGAATARGMDFRVGCDIRVRRQPEVFEGTFAADAMYGIGRQVARQLGNWDGSTNAWSIKGMSQGGTLLQKKYGVHDLREYSASKAKQFASKGLPSDLMSHANQRRIISWFQIRSFEEAWALLGAWCPFNICSSWGGASVRGDGGYLSRSGEWNHSMIVGGRRTYRRSRDVLVCQSWGSNHAERGGASTIWPFDMPWGSFWIPQSELEWIIRTGEVIAYVDHDALEMPLGDWGTGFNWS